MSTAFTSPSSWFLFGHSLAGANEIVLAYSERRQALGQSAVDPLAKGLGYTIDPDSNDPDIVRIDAGTINAYQCAETWKTVTNNDYIYVKGIFRTANGTIEAGASIPANDDDYIYYGLYRFTVTGGVATLQSTIHNFTADSAQDKTLWLEMQNWLEANCTSFVDHVNGPLNDAGTDFRYFTLATWQAAAGLNVSAGDGESFRRKVEPTDAYSYGHIQAGDLRQDIAVFEDLQKGFGALKWTAHTSHTHPATGNYKASSAETYYFHDCSEARQDIIGKWPVDGSVSSTFYFVYATLFIYSAGGWWDWRGSCYRHKSAISIISLPTFIDRSVDVYIKATATGFDYDNTGLGTSFSLYESISSSRIATVTTAQFNTGDTCPFLISGSPACPDGGTSSFAADFAGAILKWDFANA